MRKLLKISASVVAFVATTAAATTVFAAAAPQPDPPKPAGATEHEAKAKAIAGKDAYLLDLATKGYWCMSPSQSVAFRQIPNDPVKPLQVFDNLYMMGTKYVSAMVLK